MRGIVFAAFAFYKPPFTLKAQRRALVVVEGRGAARSRALAEGSLCTRHRIGQRLDMEIVKHVINFDFPHNEERAMNQRSSALHQKPFT